MDEEDEGLLMVRMAKQLQATAADRDAQMILVLQFQNGINGVMVVYKNLLTQQQRAAPATAYSYVIHSYKRR